MNSKKRGLGKGLSALIGEKPIIDEMINEDAKDEDGIVKNIPIGDIVARENQPRRDFDMDSLKDLANSIEIHGVIQPILLRKLGDKYEIVAGERRYRASKIAKLQEIPSIIIDVDNEDASKLALIENIQREDLNPIEEAMAYKQLMDDFNLKQEELANAIGKSRSYITNSIRLLNLDDKVIEYLYDGKLTTGHGKVLLGIKDREKQLKVADKIISVGLNVRETESEVKKTKSTKTRHRQKNHIDPHIMDIQDQLMRTLGTKVNLIKGDKVSKIEIEYYGEEDLKRIFDILVG
ncbi:ParB/RepB/Spo0J family partition protein [Tissierellaceae bacterium HCP3S3_D8]